MFFNKNNYYGFYTIVKIITFRREVPMSDLKVNGIVAEYNPFHNGHLYQLQDGKKRSEADYTIVVMSGNFMQRGTPAIINKFRRTEMALKSGADLVLELPALYSVSSAEFFAMGGVSILDKLGVVSHLCFGSESGDIDTLSRLADILAEESEEFTNTLKQGLRQGLSYPSARTAALTKLYPELMNCRDVLALSNNILGIEYLKALKRRNSSITPITTRRTSSNYGDRLMGNHQSSALALRHAIYDECDILSLTSQMPDSAFEILEKTLNSTGAIRLNDFSRILHYKLLTEADKGFTEYLDVSADLSDRIINHLDKFTDFKDFCDLLKSKDMTYTRISRSLMHILLDIRAEDMDSARNNDYISYARVLGFRKDAEPLLSAIKKNASIPLVTKLADAEKILDEAAYQTLKKELRINSVYESTAALKSKQAMVNEYRSPLVIV